MEESANAGVVRQVHELFNQLSTDSEDRRGSREEAELLLLFDEQIEFVQPAGAVDSRVYRGREGLRRSWDEWLDIWREHRVEIEEIAERGDDVLALSRNLFVGRDGVQVEQSGGSLFSFSDGSIVRFEAFFDQDVARQAFDRGAD
jgi:ketosteroid isomerase-like protein